MPEEKTTIDRVFHALGDSTRRLLLERLTAGPLSVSQLAVGFEMSLAAVVQHLQILEEAELVTTQKTGRVRTCRINAAGLATATQWLADRRGLWDKWLDRLGDILNDAPGET